MNAIFNKISIKKYSCPFIVSLFTEKHKLEMKTVLSMVFVGRLIVKYYQPLQQIAICTPSHA